MKWRKKCFRNSNLKAKRYNSYFNFSRFSSKSIQVRTLQQYFGHIPYNKAWVSHIVCMICLRRERKVIFILASHLIFGVGVRFDIILNTWKGNTLVGTDPLCRGATNIRIISYNYGCFFPAQHWNPERLKASTEWVHKTGAHAEIRQIFRPKSLMHPVPLSKAN